ncbi:MAG TPA: hypothetical protein VN577_16655 [Terriglobales bacterium]|nr:hypothetical protein [Terriglobales bacterium]
MTRRKIAGLSLFVVLLMAPAFSFAQTNTALFGETKVQLSNDFVSALGSLSVAPGTVFPTRLQRGIVNFPVVGGAIDLQTAKGEILHSGGLTLTAANGTKVQLQAFTIDTTGQPVITGLVSVNGQVLGRLPLFTLQLPGNLSLPLKPVHNWITLKGVGVQLSTQAATALNTVFNVTAFQAGFNIGTANVSFYSFR